MRVSLSDQTPRAYNDSQQLKGLLRKPMKTKPKYVTKKCPICDGKGTTREVVDIPGEFEIGLCISATFKLGWNDAGNSTAAETERDLRDVFTRKAFAELIDDELNTDPTKLKYTLEVKARKIK